MLIAQIEAMNSRENFIPEKNAMLMENSMRGWLPIITLVILFAWSSPVHAWMWEVGDEELSQVTGEGFSSFTLQDGVARATFNIAVSTYTQIDSLKMGYYNGGWDEDWTNVSIGSALEDAKINGVYIEAKFTDIGNASSRSLDYITVGTHDLTGDISANFNSFSGTITRTDGSFYQNNVYRQNLGTRTFTGSHSDFSITLNRTSGWRVDMTKMTVN
jgi:hypothetical protein